MMNNNNNSNNNKRKKKRKYYGYCYSIIILSVWCIIFIIYFQSTTTTTTHNVNFTTTTTTTTTNATTGVVIVAADVDANKDKDNGKDNDNDNGNHNGDHHNKEVNIALEKFYKEKEKFKEGEEVKEEEEEQVIAEFSTQTTTNITKEVKVYNSWDRIRYVCGITMKPNTTAFINPEKNCTSSRTTNNVIGDDEHDGSNRKTISTSLFLSTRIFEYDPPVPVSQQPRRTHTVNVNRTTTDDEDDTQIQTQRIPTITIRFGEEVDYPILINSYHTFGVDDKHSQSHSQCTIPCRYYNDFYPMSTKFVSFETLPHVIKEISMEGSGYYSKLTIDPNAHEQHHYYATTSFQSEIPLTYHSLPLSKSKKGSSDNDNDNGNDDNDLRSISKYPPVNFDDPSIIKGASFLAKNCGSINQREQIVKQLIDYTTTATNNATAIRNEKRPFRIDSLSTCLHNADFPLNSTLTTGTVNTVKSTSPKQDIMKLYLFHLAFENQNENDYITEKLWQTLKSGTIPIYWGASNIQDHLPSSHSVILIKDYLIIDNDDDDNNPQSNNNNDNKLQQRYRKKNKNSQVNITKLVDHLQNVANNRTLYYEYHSWRLNTTNTDTNNDSNTDTNDLDNDGDNDKSSSTSDNNNNNNNTKFNNNKMKNNDYYYQKFINKYEFTKIHSYCRICYFGYASKYGWKFNYQKQIIQELNSLEILEEIETETEQQQQQVLLISPHKLFSNSYNRSTCIDINKNRIVYPFQEIWTQTQTSSSSSSSSSSSTSSHITNTTTTTTPTTIDGDNGGDGDTDTDIDSDKYNSNYRCDISRNNHRHRTTIPYYIIDKDGKNNDKVFLERTIWDHDGVTDMEIVAVRRRSREKPISSTSTSTSTSTTTDDSGSSSVGLLLKFNITSFSKQNIKEMIVLKYHTKYNVESKWRNEKIQRYATASNKKSIKRIKMDATPTSSNSRNKDNRSKDKDNNATRTNTSSSSDNDNDDDEYDGYLKGGKLIWIQNGKSRIIFMVNKPNVLISSMNDNGGGDDNDINKNGSSTGKSYNSNSNKTSNSNNAGNNNTSNAFYYTVPLKDPGMIEIKIPTVTSQSAQTSRSLLRLRWIVEDIDTFHRNGRYKESYFSSVMVEEFFHPIEMMS